MDTISSGPSSIPNAGRGAFANRKFTKGSVISTTPMVQVTERAIAMTMPNIDATANATRQLLLNYCFGHAQSDLLLCPTTQAAMINHASSRGDGTVANVAIRWVRRKGTTIGEDYFVKDVEELNVNQSDFSSYNTRLMFEYVALRTIGGRRRIVDGLR